jgi:hypothetical protein
MVKATKENPMRNLIIALLTGVIAGQALSFQRAKTMKRLQEAKAEDNIDKMLADSFPASDVPSWTPQGLRKVV